MQIQPPMPAVPTVTVHEAKVRLDAGVRFIDVRETNEFAVARIPGSDLKPMSTIRQWYTELSPDDELLVSCRSGRRSADVVHALIEQAGFTNVSNVAGGIIAWADAGYEIDSTPA
jgi:rhodanese-related sulfurtransferase